MTAALARGDIADRNAGEQISTEYAVGTRDTELPGHQWLSEPAEVEYRAAVPNMATPTR
ncbi:hypothetical protein AB0M22_36085 [Nocardia sp. NPDC051756]|uniref:hypothetical protein n=1 Tax=Nocardia sp. NPDC051756 TaxID=3154751 RepID=UPI00343F9822